MSGFLTCCASIREGLGLVERLVTLGWKVTIIDFNEKLGTQTAEKLGKQVLFAKANVIKYEEQAEAFVETWKKWGRVDIGMNVLLYLLYLQRFS
jgi:NAD(P)-dependent dehydrogenase (short-subunit alcohol dehydrogenase family)